MNTFLIAGSIFLSALANVNKPILIYPGGENIVFDIHPEGLIVTGSYDIIVDSSNYNPIKDGDIRVGDLIVEVNNSKIASLNDFNSLLEPFSSEAFKYLELGIKRSNKLLKRQIKYIYDGNKIRTGLYVKSNVYGVGTLSFVTESGLYGALGHEVYDETTKSVINPNGGNIYFESVKRINKGTNNLPGNKEAYLELVKAEGNIECNTKYGMFGRTTYIPKQKPLILARQSEVKEGIAYIQSTISSKLVERFEIRITSLKAQDMSETKGISFTITDKRLIDVAGGVYSGMSGSPIIQNDKIVGVVTHVVTSNIRNGYGLYMENMYYQAIKNLT